MLLLRSVTFVSDRSLSPAVDPSFQYCNSMNDSTINQSIHNTTERKLQTFRGLKQTVPHLLSKSLISLHVSFFFSIESFIFIYRYQV
jgi:hypothetical protein